MNPGLWSQHWSMGEGLVWGEISAQNIDSLLQHELFYLYWNKVSHPLLIDIECGLIISFDYLWTEMINDKAKEDWIHFCSDLHFVAFCTINILWTFLSPSLGKYCVDKSSAYCFSMIVLAGLSCTLITPQNDIFLPHQWLKHQCPSLSIFDEFFIK